MKTLPPAAPTKVTETFTYDDLQRIRTASRAWEGLPGESPSQESYTYDDLGNLLSKNDYGTAYAYGTSARATGNAGPHAVHTVTKAPSAGGGTAQFSYDANGNLLFGDGRRIDFDFMDRPVRVCTGTDAACLPNAPWPGATSEFSYAPDGARYRLVVSGAVEPGFGPKTVYYVDKDYELTVWPASGSSRPAPVEEERTYLGSAVVYRRGASREVRCPHVDRLGSLDAVTDESGAELMVDAHGYDPWGKPRGRTWIGSGERLHPGGETPEVSNPPGTGVTTNRGFTGHEHLDGHHLIHMNGRVYDYRLGRFLSVDPIISEPGNPQAVNPYSYIGNNPLSGVDPTGYLPAEITGMNCAFGCTNRTGSHIGVPLRSDLPLPGKGGGVTAATSGATSGPQVQGKPAADAGNAKQVAGKGKPEEAAKGGKSEREYPLSLLGTETWSRAWAATHGGSEVVPGEGDVVSLAGDKFELGDNEQSVTFMKHYLRLANQKEDSAVIGSAMVVAGGVRLVGAALDAALARVATKAAGAAGAEASAGAEAVKTAVDANKLAHIFGNPAHNLGPVLQQFGGSQAAAFAAIKAATEAAVKAQGLTGVFETAVRVAGAQVTVRGAVVQGAVKIGTAFIP